MVTSLRSLGLRIELSRACRLVLGPDGLLGVCCSPAAKENKFDAEAALLTRERVRRGLPDDVEASGGSFSLKNGLRVDAFDIAPSE